MKHVAAMSIRAIILSSFLFLAAPLFARDKTDLMVMKNGDRMTCEIKGLEGGVQAHSLIVAR